MKMILMAGALSLAATYVAVGMATQKTSLNPKGGVAASAVKSEAPGKVAIFAGYDGHFRVQATIAGQTVPMLVDTGATTVALSYEQGRSLGLVTPADNFDLRVSTANGWAGAKRVVLRDIRIGSVTVPEVTAIVMRQGAMDGNLLGMSFLGRLRRMETANGRLTLER